MPTFRLGDCSVDLAVQPLAGALAAADRQTAWRVLLELRARPSLRGPALDRTELAELLTVWRGLLADWPAGQVETLLPVHLGPALLSVIDWVLLPCLGPAPVAPVADTAVLQFLQALAAELAQRYRFGATASDTPADWRAAWQGTP